MERRDEELYGLASGLVEGMGYTLVTVDDIVDHGRRVFRFYIDHPRGISVEDCSSVSREIEYLLDAEFDFEGAYVLEVSSPGLDHALKSEREFAYFVGRPARLVLREAIEETNVVVGVLAPAGPGEVRIRMDGDRELSVAVTDIARARLIVPE